MPYLILLASLFLPAVCSAQELPPKQAYPFSVKQIHSGHSLTDPLFYPHWPGQYVNLMGQVLQQPAWQIMDKSIGKSTTPGSSLSARWSTPPGFGAPDARNGIANWELLSITERVPLLYEGGSTQAWYIQGIQDQRNALSQFVNNAWTNGNAGKGAPTLLWTTWVSIDGSNGDFRQMLDVQGLEWERMQDHANDRRPAGAPPVYMIPGHKMMARLFDDIKKGLVPGITAIEQFFSDAIHTNERGAYAIAMIHYACIYNRSPVGLPNILIPNAPAGTPLPSPELAAYLQKMVWEVVTSYDRTGVTSTTSVDESAETNHITVSPNPADGVITVQLPTSYELASEIIVRDINGSIVLKAPLGPLTNTTTINVNELPRGMYSVWGHPNCRAYGVPVLLK
ncbi:MAG: T9SS type A sorting domain-containing protein [Candidatus Kapabacteria bacterium]|nr:T9SS type A sorting domain-containing protein [Candidatus Kapabacteria bacterium]